MFKLRIVKLVLIFIIQLKEFNPRTQKITDTDTRMGTTTFGNYINIIYVRNYNL